MFGFDKSLEEIARGYTSEEYSLALFNTLLNYLKINGIIDIDDYLKYHSDKFEEVLKMTVESEKKLRETRIQEIKANLEKSKESGGING